MSKSYQYDLQVKKEHLDALDHVNNVQYLQWIQEIAGAHWESLIKDKESDYGIWVVRSHTINYKRSAKQNDWLTLKTHVALTEGYLSQRIVEIYFKDTTILVAQCTTQWCYLDPKTQKILRIPQEIQALFS
ncbi:thioesterase [Flavobacteriaceae bacterium]|nr:thioesterase [Flavobacteriaceae bacterium]